MATWGASCFTASAVAVATGYSAMFLELDGAALADAGVVSAQCVAEIAEQVAVALSSTTLLRSGAPLASPTS
jgi:nicotinamide mononucleotide (NMN) deamidase PncC